MAGDVMHVYLRASLEDLSSVLPDKNPVDSYAYELRKSLVRTYRMKIPILQMMIELVGSWSEVWKMDGGIGQNKLL